MTRLRGLHVLRKTSKLSGSLNKTGNLTQIATHLRMLSSVDLEAPRDTVIVGGGIVGVSLAYHLARKGKDVLLLEKTDLTAGSTWHAAGLVTLYHPTPNIKRVHLDSINLYAQITAETGQEVGFHRPGSLRLATSPARLDEMRYTIGRQMHKDAPMRLLSQVEVADLVPILNMDNIHGGLFTPADGHIDPYSLTQALAAGARKRGAQIMLNTEVTALEPASDGSWTVGTPSGQIKANRVVNCTGFWGREVGKLAGGPELPLVPVQHQYLVTKTVPEVAALKGKEFPVLRHLDGSFYLRQERDGLLVGPYESQDVMVQMEDWARNRVPHGFGRELYAGDLDRLSPHLEVCMRDFPCFASAEIMTVVNGPITYTPDLLPMVGPSPFLPNMWMAVGFGYGIVHGGGIGKFLTEWICEGESPYELIELDPGRYGQWTDIEYALAKTRESYGMNNAFSYPFEERTAGRPGKRLSGLHNKLVKAGAHMGFSVGWESPLWYAAEGEVPEYKPSFFRTNWQLEQHREYATVTERVGVADLSTFGKFRLTGPESRQFLDRLVAGTVPAPGRTSLVHVLTPRARVYAEFTVTCQSDGSFLIITGGRNEYHDLRYLNQMKKQLNADVDIENITDKFGVISIAGPKARHLLKKITGSDVATWKFLEAREAIIGNVPCTAIRISYTGELGWEFFLKMEDMEQLYDAILTAGAEFGIGHFGSRVMNTLRIEKGFRAWGNEMNKDTTPIETGLMPFVRMKKKVDFVGKEALVKQLAQVPARKVVHLAIDPEITNLEPEGDEAVLSEGKPVGNTTSGCWSQALGRGLAFANLPSFLTVPGTEVAVMLGGEPRKAVVLEGPPALTQPAREAIGQ